MNGKGSDHTVENAQADLRYAVRLCSEHPYNMLALISSHGHLTHISHLSEIA